MESSANPLRAGSLQLSLSRRVGGSAAGLYGFFLVALVAGSAGGFRPTTWGWTGLVTFWLAALTLLARDELELQPLALWYAGGLTAFGGWVTLSNVWTASVPSTMHEVQRDLMYVGVVASALFMVRSSTTQQLLGGVLGGIVALDLYALGTRLLPDRLGHFDSVAYNYRLAGTITYWNGLGIFSVVGILLALGFAARGTHLLSRALAGAVLPPLAATMYFTFSRGSWYALAVGLIAAIAVDPRRLQLLAVSIGLTPWAAAAIAVGAARPGLITIGASLRQATTDGHRVALVVVALSLGSALTALGTGVLERRLTFPAAVRTAFASLLVAALVGGMALAWTTKGSPVTLAKRGWASFQSTSGGGKIGDPSVSNRLLSLSSNGRIDLWRVALHRFEASPLTGDGAGTYWQAWAKYRNIPGSSTQPHSLYLGTLAELGIFGLLLVGLALLMPIVAAIRTRTRPLAPAALGAYVAYAAHTGIDWDWALPGVTIPALLCGIALLQGGPARVRPLRPRARVPAIAVIAFFAISTLPTLLADQALAHGRRNLPQHPGAALRNADTARRWAPWSSDPDELAGDSLRAEGNLAGARAAYGRAIARDRENWTLWTRLADVSHGGNRLAALRAAHALNPAVVVK